MNNNHNELNKRLLNHNFSRDAGWGIPFEVAKIVAEHYANAENAIAVLSDMASDVSFICYGRLGEKLGIGRGCEEVRSIWEKKILDVICPDDLADKIVLELQYHTFVGQMQRTRRSDYYLQHFIRFMSPEGVYTTVRHRIYYLDYDKDDNVMLALCLYTAASQNAGAVGIINSLDDTLVQASFANLQGLLSVRECEVLNLIGRGLPSKTIAEELCISINTVNNHRQNIMKKLHCKNMIAALGVASKLGFPGSK